MLVFPTKKRRRKKNIKKLYLRKVDTTQNDNYIAEISSKR